jgi:hypothetical protein
MHFHPGWSGPAEGFGHGGYYTGDDHDGSVGHQQDRKAPRQENQIVWNAKQWMPKAVSSTDGSGGNQDQTGPRSETEKPSGQFLILIVMSH